MCVHIFMFNRYTCTYIHAYMYVYTQISALCQCARVLPVAHICIFHVVYLRK